MLRSKARLSVCAPCPGVASRDHSARTARRTKRARLAQLQSVLPQAAWRSDKSWTWSPLARWTVVCSGCGCGAQTPPPKHGACCSLPLPVHRADAHARCPRADAREAYRLRRTCGWVSFKTSRGAALLTKLKDGPARSPTLLSGSSTPVSAPAAMAVCRCPRLPLTLRASRAFSALPRSAHLAARVAPAHYTAIDRVVSTTAGASRRHPQRAELRGAVPRFPASRAILCPWRARGCKAAATHLASWHCYSTSSESARGDAWSLPRHTGKPECAHERTEARK